METLKPYYHDEDSGITIYHGNCSDILPHLPKVDLVLTDPPYGIGADKPRGNTGRNGHIPQRKYPETNWDTSPPDSELMELVASAGKNAVIWGGNYFGLSPSSGWLVWDKDNGTNRYADCELAWTNFNMATRRFVWKWHGFLQDSDAPKEYRWHPTQKPIQVMAWCLSFAPDAQTILDPFMGSGTTLVAAKQLGRKAIGIELEEKYCEIAVQRLAQKVLDFGQEVRS